MARVSYTYKGEEILFDDRTDEWYWEDTRNASMKVVKAAIDKVQKVKFDATKAYLCSGYRSEEFTEVTVTSKASDRGFWIRKDSGHRSKENEGNLFSYTAANKAMIKKIKENRAAAAKLDDEYYDMEKALEKFTVPKSEPDDEAKK